MPATKRIDGDYTITVPLDDTLTLDATSSAPGLGGVVMTGNLTVLGTTTTVGAEDLIVSDNIITLNDGETGPGVTLGIAGIEVDRGDDITPGQLRALLLWDEANDVWVVNFGDGLADREVVTGPIGAATPLFNLIEDAAPQINNTIGLDVNGAPIFAVINADVELVVTGTGQITINGPLVFNNTTVPALANMVIDEPALYTGADTGGGTQLHFKTRTSGGVVEGVDTTTGELVSKTKAMVFGLIF